MQSKERVTFVSNIVEYLPGFDIPFEYQLPLNNRQLQNFTVAVYNPVTVDVSDVRTLWVYMYDMCTSFLFFIDIHQIFEHHCEELSTRVCTKSCRR